MPLTDIFAAFRWWLVIMAIGAAATPLTLYLFRRLPDRGYAFAKLVGLLIVSYLFWLLGSLGFLANNLGGILFALLLLVGLSIWGLKINDSRLKNDHQSLIFDLSVWLRANRTQVIITELLFALLFALWVGVRAQNPAITATEKPMEFAFLNAIGRSPTFPPLDPWLSGFAISYYYFGYVMMSVLARLAAVPEYIAFNLGIAWLVAGSGTAAFGLVYNLTAGLIRKDPPPAPRPPRSPATLPLLLGLIAAIALPIAGNLEIGLEILHGNGAGSTQFWQWLDVRDLNGPPQLTDTPRYETTTWWWWRSSRVIHEYHLNGRPEEGLEPIAEVPGFSFVLGDMHPHVLALPFAFLSLAVAYLWYLQGFKINDLRLKRSELRALIFNLGSSDRTLWLFTALLLGGLSFLNTWDVLIHLFVVLGAFVLAQWRVEGWHGRHLTRALILGGTLVVAAVLLYLPFYIGFRSQAGPPFLLPMLMRPTRLVHFLIIFGMPLLPITVLLLALAARQRFRGWQTGLSIAAGLLSVLLFTMLLLGWVVASSPEGAGRVGGLATDLGVSLPLRPEGTVAPGWGLTAVFAILPAIINARLAYPALTLFLLTLITLVIIAWQTHVNPERQGTEQNTAPSPLPFILLLTGTGALLTLGPEFVYLRDNFGFRLNTIFKFYYQAWVMFGVAALAGLAYLWREIRPAAIVTATGYGLALLVALLFPYHAIDSRAAEYRGPDTAETRLPPTLDGLAQMENFNPDELAAITWLRQNVPGTPTILEAVGGQYSNYARISASTGLPTLLGWAGHEYQWRGSTPEPALRDPAVQDIYGPASWENTAVLLNSYDVDYIYVGGLELNTYGPQAAEKFDGRLPVVYQNNTVTIYRWEPQ